MKERCFRLSALVVRADNAYSVQSLPKLQRTLSYVQVQALQLSIFSDGGGGVVRCAILVAGMPGSGKSLFAEAARELSIPVVSMGDVVRLEAIKRGLQTDAETMAHLARTLREERGSCAVAELVLERAPQAPVVAIEGVRSREEVAFFKKHFEKVIVVAIHSSPRTRFARLTARRRRDDPASWEEFVERDERELAMGLGEVIALADYMLVNEDESKEDFLRKCKVQLSKMLEDLHRSA